VLFYALNDYKHNDQSGDDQKVHEKANDPSDFQVPFMPGHKLSIVPVLRYSAGTHRVSSKSYVIPSHRT
jgi:hypothetical protein